MITERQTLTGCVALLALLALVVGCQSAGRKMASAGRRAGRAGSDILTASGINVLLIPPGIMLAAPCYMAAAPLYYGGCAIAKEKPEEEPFAP